MFSNRIRSEIETIARRSGLEPAALLAIAEVESAGKAFANVGGRREPLIRFEGHYFDRRLPADKRAAARAAGLADPKAGTVRNPASQAARWTMLAKAAAIDHKAAHEAVSWGLGQVMGAHWEWLGYASVDALVAEARAGAGGQVALMVRYIEKAGLAGAIRRHDWAAFARGYNGPDYKRHGYDRKIAAAYVRYAGEIAAAALANAPLRRRSTGKAVRELQDLLAAAGYWVSSDGIFGPKTEAAIRDVQRARSLDVDGVAGRKTLEALKGNSIEATPASMFEAPTPTRSFWPWFLLWLRGLWRD